MGLFTRKSTASSPASLTAAAHVLDLADERDQRLLKRGPQAWQRDAWNWYDELGEISYAATWYSDALSRIRLVPALIDEPGAPPKVIREENLDELKIDAETYALLNATLARLRGSDGGHAELNRLGNLNLFIAGDGYLVGAKNGDGIEEWDFLSVDELILKDGKYARRAAPSSGMLDTEGTELDDDTFVCRIYKRHPRWSGWPNSGMRAANALCEELKLLVDAGLALSASRVPMGAWMLPNGMSFGDVDPTEDDEDDGAGDSFTDDILHHMMTAIREPKSAARFAPFIVRGEREDIAAAKFEPFVRQFDSDLMSRVQDVLGRMATVLDLPGEVLTGKANLNHWSAFVVDEEGFKYHLEPGALVWVSGLTTGYYRPALREAGLEDAGKFGIWYDPSELVSHPNDGDDAKWQHEAMLISDAAVRRRLGTPETDAPDDAEVMRRVAIKVAERATPRIQTTEENVVDDTTKVGPPPVVLPDAAPAPKAPAGPPVAQHALVASGARAPSGRRLGSIEQALFLRLRTEADGAMRRALERAGNRLRNLAQKEPAFRTAVRDAEAIDVAALLGPNVVERLTSSSDDVLAGAFAGLLPLFSKLTQQAQAQALRAAGIDDYESLAESEALAHARTDGSAVLEAGLVGLAASLLYAPHREAPPAGEFDSTALVTGGPIRDALEAAGGGAPDDGAGSALFGQTMLDVLSNADVTVGDYTWIYGEEARDHPFAGHEDLEGVPFASFDDDVLAVQPGDEWIGDRYAPQDHDGCLCGFFRELADGSTQEGE